MDVSFSNELGALERAVNRLGEAVARQQRSAGNNFERIVLADLSACCARMTTEEVRFRSIVNEARQGRFYAPPGGSGESPTP